MRTTTVLLILLILFPCFYDIILQTVAATVMNASLIPVLQTIPCRDATYEGDLEPRVNQVAGTTMSYTTEYLDPDQRCSGVLCIIFCKTVDIFQPTTYAHDPPLMHQGRPVHGRSKQLPRRRRTYSRLVPLRCDGQSPRPLSLIHFYGMLVLNLDACKLLFLTMPMPNSAAPIYIDGIRSAPCNTNNTCNLEQHITECPKIQVLRQTPLPANAKYCNLLFSGSSNDYVQILHANQYKVIAHNKYIYLPCLTYKTIRHNGRSAGNKYLSLDEILALYSPKCKRHSLRSMYLYLILVPSVIQTCANIYHDLCLLQYIPTIGLADEIQSTRESEHTLDRTFGKSIQMITHAEPHHSRTPSKVRSTTRCAYMITRVDRVIICVYDNINPGTKHAFKKCVVHYDYRITHLRPYEYDQYWYLMNYSVSSLYNKMLIQYQYHHDRRVINMQSMNLRLYMSIANTCFKPIMGHHGPRLAIAIALALMYPPLTMTTIANPCEQGVRRYVVYMLRLISMRVSCNYNPLSLCYCISRPGHKMLIYTRDETGPTTAQESETITPTPRSKLNTKRLPVLNGTDNTANEKTMVYIKFKVIACDGKLIPGGHASYTMVRDICVVYANLEAESYPDALRLSPHNSWDTCPPWRCCGGLGDIILCVVIFMVVIFRMYIELETDNDIDCVTSKKSLKCSQALKV